MKKLILAALSLIVAQLSFSQCIPDGSITTPGIIMSSNTLNCIDQGVPYSDTIQFMNFDSIFFNNNWIELQRLRIDSVNNLPCGIDWELSNANGIFDNSEQGCILISGTTDDVIGQYTLQIWASIDLGSGFFGPLQASNFDLLTFYVRVKPSAGVCPPIDTLAVSEISDCEVHYGLPIQIVSSEGTLLCSGNVGMSTVLSVNTQLGSGHYSYSWSPGTNLSCTDCANPAYTTDGTPNSSEDIMVTVTDSVSGLSNTDMITINTDICDGVEEYEYSHLNIYPNPSEGIFIVQPGFSSSNTFDLSVKNIQGQEVVVRSYTNKGSLLELDLMNVPTGIYFVYLTDGSRHYMNKVVKK